ncbi:MAG: DUF1987 domain-containing protein [Flavobacteriales bacterium]
MKAVHLEATYNTPKVDFDPKTGELKLYGRSIPEQPSVFYSPLISWISEFGDGKPPRIKFMMMVDYINSSSVKYIMGLFEKLEQIRHNGTDVQVEWYYEEDDEEMRDVGEEYEEAVDVPFTFIALEEFD